MKTTTEYAAEIRAEYKRHGWTSRQIGVRTEYFSLGSAIHVTVKDASILLSAVHNIAQQAERIRRCEVTGEILGGGNTYVHVRYSSDAQDVFSRCYAESINQALAHIAPGSNELQPIKGTPYLVGRYDNLLTLRPWSGSCQIQQCLSVDVMAHAVGALMAQQEARA